MISPFLPLDERTSEHQTLTVISCRKWSLTFNNERQWVCDLCGKVNILWQWKKGWRLELCETFGICKWKKKTLYDNFNIHECESSVRVILKIYNRNIYLCVRAGNCVSVPHAFTFAIFRFAFSNYRERLQSMRALRSPLRTIQEACTRKSIKNSSRKW